MSQQRNHVLYVRYSAQTLQLFSWDARHYRRQIVNALGKRNVANGMSREWCILDGAWPTISIPLETPCWGLRRCPARRRRRWAPGGPRAVGPAHSTFATWRTARDCFCFLRGEHPDSLGEGGEGRRPIQRNLLHRLGSQQFPISEFSEGSGFLLIWASEQKRVL